MVPVCPSQFAAGWFFFSSRRRHTRLTCDWSSDVCSSDLACSFELLRPLRRLAFDIASQETVFHARFLDDSFSHIVKRDHANESVTLEHGQVARSEERRVGKECRSMCSPAPCKNGTGTAPA